MRLCKHRKELYCFHKIILKIRANLKRHNRVYILSSKHTYRPMRVHVKAQLFYKNICVYLIQQIGLKKYNLVVGILISKPMWYFKCKL